MKRWIPLVILGFLAGCEYFQGAPGSPGLNGQDGIDGVDGTVWLAGTEIPSSSTGKDGDLFLHTETL